MTNRELREKAVARFQTALNNAGMQRSSGIEEKPKYWRGTVKEFTESTFLRFQVTDNIEQRAADDQPFDRIVYINGVLYTRNGFGDADYQNLADNIERECKKLNITMIFSDEGEDTSLDPESPIAYCNFEARQVLLKGE